MKLTNTAARLKTIMDERNLRQIDVIRMAQPFCDKYDVKLGKNDMSQYLSGKVVPGQEKLTILGLTLDVSEAWLMGYEVPRERTSDDTPSGFITMPSMSAVPLVGRIACGDPITAEENLDGYVSTPDSWGASFALMCRGDSMAPRIQDGDLVAIKKQSTVENGQIAAVRIGDEATLKRVYLSEGRLILQPENPAYEPIVLIGDEISSARIEGLAVGLCRGL